MFADEIEKELKRMEDERAAQTIEPSGPAAPDVFNGAKRNGAKRPLVSIWQQLHDNYVTWMKIQSGPLQIEDRLRFDVSDLNTLGELRDVEAQQWMAICEGIGWTATGAVALSWCAGAELQQVWDGWNASGTTLIPTPMAERPARLLNPELILDSSSLSQIIEAGDGHSLPVCALIAALSAPLTIDIPYDRLMTAKPALASFLKSRILQKPKRSADEEKLLVALNETIFGTAYDIW